MSVILIVTFCLLIGSLLSLNYLPVSKRRMLYASKIHCSGSGEVLKELKLLRHETFNELKLLRHETFNELKLLRHETLLLRNESSNRFDQLNGEISSLSKRLDKVNGRLESISQNMGSLNENYLRLEATKMFGVDWTREWLSRSLYNLVHQVEDVLPCKKETKEKGTSQQLNFVRI